MGGDGWRTHREAHTSHWSVITLSLSNLFYGLLLDGYMGGLGIV